MTVRHLPMEWATEQGAHVVSIFSSTLHRAAGNRCVDHRLAEQLPVGTVSRTHSSSTKRLELIGWRCRSASEASRCSPSTGTGYESGTNRLGRNCPHATSS